MNIKKAFVLLTSAFAFSEARFLTAQGEYCDQWTKCSSDFQCVNKKCVPLSCTSNANCGQGFQCRNSKCVSLTPTGDTGRYCDQWTPCNTDQRCYSSKCVPLKCLEETDCATGFTCWRGQCISGGYTGKQGQYCDPWTKCQSKDQCVNKKCVPFICTRTPDCALGYVCSQGYCVQINNNHTRGRYCDAQNECDILHQCRQSQCFWKQQP